MPAKKKKKKPGGMTGKPPLTEPRVQIFSKFMGCDFRLSPRDFSVDFAEDTDEQSDQMSTLMVIQNNAHISGMQGTIETRQSLVELFRAPAGKTFTGISTLVENVFYAACSDGSVHYGRLTEGKPGNMDKTVHLIDNDGSGAQDNTWTYLGYADDKLIGMTAGGQLWTAPIGTYALENARTVPDPSALSFASLTAKGSLTISQTSTDACPFRISLAYTRLNKYGPTLPSDPLVFYASKPTSEWSGAAYLQISGTEPDGYAITAVELYYTEGEAREPAFLTRMNLTADTGQDKTWTYYWVGYQYDTSMWALANLSLPTQNYTAGVPASKLNVIDGQLYFWGGTPTHRIWIGGNPGNRFSVSTGTGGGFVDVEPGTGTVVREVLRFKTQQGASIVTALCDNPNSQREHRFNLVESNISISDEQSVKGWYAEKVAGTVGCKSSKGAVVAGDGLYAVSRYGLAITTLTMEYNSQLQVQYVSDPISPVFLKQYGSQLESSVLFYVNDVLYMTFGCADASLDNVVFCYDIGGKAWWTYTIDVDSAILDMVHIDYENNREGIGIITANKIYLLPTTRTDSVDEIPNHDILIESAELAVMQPITSMQHLSQLELHFDYFIGELTVVVEMIDQFGRRIEVRKNIMHTTPQRQLTEYMRIDKVVESYKLSLMGQARMRLTHFVTKSYPKSNRIGMVYGFDSRQSHSGAGSIQRTFADYNDLKKAIIP